MRKIFFVKGPHNILFVAGIVGCLFFLEALFQQLYFECDFKILAIGIKCQQPLNNRCVYEYSVKNKDGSLDAVELDGYMFRGEELVVGKSIKKNKLSFGYQVDGKKLAWGFLKYYLWILFLSLSMLGLWRYLTCKLIISKIR